MEDDDELPAEAYAWEGSLERSWDAVEMRAGGLLRGANAQHLRSTARRSVHVGVKRGMLRTLFLVVDCSRNAQDQDGEMRPSRLAVMQEAASTFIRSYFDQNPISTLALAIMCNGVVEMRTEPSCNARQHIGELQKLKPADCRGNASLQSALDRACEALAAIPSFMAREVILLSTSLSTYDKGDIHSTIASLVKAKVHVSVFSLLAEVMYPPSLTPARIQVSIVCLGARRCLYARGSLSRRMAALESRQRPHIFGAHGWASARSTSLLLIHAATHFRAFNLFAGNC